MKLSPGFVLRCALALALFAVACDDDGGGASGYDYYVDAVAGDDANPGTKRLPFASITQALSAAGEGDRIRVLPGTYDAANGEVFPLQISDGIELIGNVSERGIDTFIHGGAPSPVPSYPTNPPVTMVVASNAEVAGFTLTSSAAGNRIGIHSIGDAVYIHHNTIRDYVPGAGGSVADGLIMSAGSDAKLEYNTVVSNQRGLNLFQGGNRTKLEGNLVTGNNSGVTTAPSANYYDFGGGSLGSVGGNVFSCNTTNDVQVWYGNTLDMKQNFWDHVPPTVGTTNADLREFTDIGEPDPVYDTSDAQLSELACL